MEGELLESEFSRPGRVYFAVKPTALRRAVNTLFDKLGARFMTISAIDHGLDIELLHHFSLGKVVITIRTTYPKETSKADSIVDMIPAANLIEREITDLFGITFTGHPNPERLILPNDWPPENRPLRKPVEGSLPPIARNPAENLLTTGYLTGLPSYVRRRREKAGLPSTPPGIGSDANSLPRFQELIKLTGYDGRAGFSWERKKLRYG